MIFSLVSFDVLTGKIVISAQSQILNGKNCCSHGIPVFVAVPSEASVSSPSSVSSGVSKTDLILTATLAQDAIIFLESAL